MAEVSMTVVARSDVGRVRDNNEDAFTVTDLDSGDRIQGDKAASRLDVNERGVLMVVSDGMGGHAAGEVASALVVDSLRKALSDDAAERTSLHRLIENAVRRANEDVWEAARASSKKGMGATLTAVLVHRTEAYIAEVGDSRAYLLRSGRLRQITKDQSFVQMLIDAGLMTPEQAKDAPQKNVILQAMGLEQNVHVALGRLQLRRDDRLLLCCDGVWSLVSDDELQKILSGEDLESACNRIIALANERGGDDNITAIVASVQGDGLPTPRPRETVTQTLEVIQEYGGSKQAPKPADESTSPPPPVKEEKRLEPSPPPARGEAMKYLAVGACIGVAILIAVLLWAMR